MRTHWHAAPRLTQAGPRDGDIGGVRQVPLIDRMEGMVRRRMVITMLNDGVRDGRLPRVSGGSSCQHGRRWSCADAQEARALTIELEA